ncbi:uncharacterized protein BDR25DRAFT_351680 [Lindgomyces ingoldianus]|uniref:Uncharacterized protein n=1 Tax=Lindgomyces ingoldianus TaxID=673940 RepID=A0ACB6R4F0_9PLEO|nr:uncharacterized protein BDR25DRAFT_351680 [Lindgomyces ingoldianus]KAF2474148.1 hypothetical protein BDR25DRAFT_351680 [Lindgomyces ingoldianus]
MFLSQLTPNQLVTPHESRAEDTASTPSDNSSEEETSSRDSTKMRQPRSREAIMAVFTGQYIVGLAYLVVAFIKHKEVSYYHLRIIFGLSSINMAVALVSEYTRVNLLRRSGGLKNWIRRTIDMPPRMCITSFGLLILTICYVAFIIYTIVRRGKDTNFRTCFPADYWLFPLTVVHSGGLVFFLAGALIKSEGFVVYRMSSWAGYILMSTVLVIFHYVQLIHITRAFRGPIGRMNPELEFGFGQLLMFFMILQLFVEFGIGLCCQYPHFWHLTDLLTIHSGSRLLASTSINPWKKYSSLVRKLRQEILQIWYSGPKKVIRKSKQGISSLLRRLSGGLCLPLRKTKTTKAESGPDDSPNQPLKANAENDGKSDKSPAARPHSQERSSSDDTYRVEDGRGAVYGIHLSGHLQAKLIGAIECLEVKETLDTLVSSTGADRLQCQRSLRTEDIITKRRRITRLGFLQSGNERALKLDKYTGLR